MKRKLLTALLCSSLLMPGTVVPVIAQEAGTELQSEATIVHSGKIGTADWTIDSNGVLTIGAGEFTNNDKDYEWPWQSYRSSITRVDGTAKFKVTGSLAHMFSGDRFLKSINLSGFDTSNVTDMSWMFNECSGLTSLDLSSFDTSKVTDMGFMFNGCSGLTSLDLSSLDTSNVTDMQQMFCGCSGLTSLDLSPLDTSKVTCMSDMFSDCSSLTSLDLSSLDTSNVTSMWAMFYNCSGLTSLDLSSFDTSKVTDMGFMFSGCSDLSSLDLSSFDTSNVTNMGYMFYGCSGLTSLDLSPLDTSNVIYMSEMFSGCSSLATIRYSQKGASVLNELPEQSGWYQNNKGPYSISTLPVLKDEESALLTRPKVEPPKKDQISDAVVSNINSQYFYTGNPITPEPALSMNGKTLVKGTDYSISFANNVNPGTAAITITGSGSYTGTKTITFQITKKAVETQKTVMHRLYNPNSGEHFYTANTAEKDYLVKLGWKYEGEGWKAPEKSNAPVYRLYNPNAGDHHYTLDEKEKEALIKLGWNYEGIGWYSDENKAVPLYREYNPNAKAGSHNYTPNKNEHDHLTSIGWKDEGIAWYGLK